MTAAALRILRGGGRDVYGRALAAPHATTGEWWQQQLAEVEEGDLAEGEEAWRPSAASLRTFLETEVAESYASSRQQLSAYPDVRRQAWGESLDVLRAQKLQNYDAQLDRASSGYWACSSSFRWSGSPRPGRSSTSVRE